MFTDVLNELEKKKPCRSLVRKTLVVFLTSTNKTTGKSFLYALCLYNRAAMQPATVEPADETMLLSVTVMLTREIRCTGETL